MTTRDNRGLDITRDLNKATVPGEGLDAETALGQTTISIDTTELGSAAIDPAADFLPFYDTSAGIHKRILPQNLPAAAGAAEGCVVSVFTSDGTWVKPSGASGVYVQVIGGGGGGGGGSFRTAAPYQSGTGGGGGGITWGWLSAADLPDTVEVTVGAGGAGGLGPTVAAAGGAGGNGTAGGYSAFGKIRANGGNAGQGGVASEGPTPGASGGGGLYSGISSASTDDDTAQTVVTDGDVNCGAGGGGGTAEGVTIRPSGRGSHVNGYPLTAAGGGAAGTDATGANGGDGGAGASQPAGSPLPGCGGGGGGTASGSGFRAGDGGAGGLYGGGGGGGGAYRATGGTRAGNGGAGGQGIVVVIAFL